MSRLPVVVAVLVLVAACSGPAPGPAPEAAPARPGTPGALIDLSDWYLTLPTGEEGDPDTVEQPRLATFSSDWFHLDPRGDGIVFTSNAGGVTTENSTYPRSELREMDGEDKASWSNRAGVHTMALRQAVTAVPPRKPEVVTAQIHDRKSDVVEIRLEGTRLVAQYDDGDSDVVIDPAYVLGTPYDLRLVATQGRVDVSYNGRIVASITTSGDGWYFKTGSYLQSNTAKGDAPGAVGQVVLYSLQVTHSS